MTDFVWDYIIAGAGISGTLSALEISTKYPDAKILMLEKESRVGGRLKVSDSNSSYGLGLHKMAEKLVDYFQASIHKSPVDLSLPKENKSKNDISKFSLLAAQKLYPVDNDPISNKGFRSLGGAAAQKNWNEFNETVLQNEANDKPISHYWKTGKKSAGVVVMQHYLSLIHI